MKRFIDFLIEAMMSRTDALKVLGLQSNFTDDQLKTAYKKAAVANHPDKGGDVAKMQQINVARDVLANPTSAASFGPSSRASQKYRDAASSYHNNHADDYEDDELRDPQPVKKNIPRDAALNMFREKLDAETRVAASKLFQIFIPLNTSGPNKEYLGLVRKSHIFLGGFAYYVNGIYEAEVSGGRIGKLRVKRVLPTATARMVWESYDSLVWLMKELSVVVNLKNVSEKKIADVFIRYFQNMTKIDKNIK